MASLLRLRLTPLRFLRHNGSPAIPCDLTTTTRLSPGTFPRPVPPIAPSEHGWVPASTPEGGLPVLDLTTRTPNGVHRAPRTFTTSRKCELP